MGSGKRIPDDVRAAITSALLNDPYRRHVDLALTYGCSTKVVGQIARAAGVVSPRGRRPKDHDADSDLALVGGHWQPGRHGILRWVS